jgi:hypothetical protein
VPAANFVLRVCQTQGMTCSAESVISDTRCAEKRRFCRKFCVAESLTPACLPMTEYAQRCKHAVFVHIVKLRNGWHVPGA